MIATGRRRSSGRDVLQTLTILQRRPTRIVHGRHIYVPVVPPRPDGGTDGRDHPPPTRHIRPGIEPGISRSRGSPVKLERPSRLRRREGIVRRDDSAGRARGKIRAPEHGFATVRLAVPPPTSSPPNISAGANGDSPGYYIRHCTGEDLNAPVKGLTRRCRSRSPCDYRSATT